MATFKIKLEDKAAFLNRLEKQDVPMDSSKIKDNKLEGYFEVDIVDPKQLEVVKTILKQSPKINTIKEMKKFTKNELKEMIRQELSGVIAEKKKMEDEDKKEKLDEAMDWESLRQAAQPLIDFLRDNAGYLATVGGIVGIAKYLGSSLSKEQEKTGKSATPRTDRMTGYGR
jgi:hypothetical protein